MRSHWLIGSSARVAASTAAMTSSAAGRMRRTRAAQNDRSERVPVAAASRSMWPVIRNPEITKKTSTPTKPPGSQRGSKW